MNITLPDKTSAVYKELLKLIDYKVNLAVTWLAEHNIEYVNNIYVDNHLYRLYIPRKDLLLDFETYPVNSIQYNYIRINYDTDIIRVLERLFTHIVLNTQDLVPKQTNQRETNKFLRENSAAPVYAENALRIAYTQSDVIYQCLILQNNKIIRNVTKQGYSVTMGTYMLLRYLNEGFGISGMQIKENMDNYYAYALYQILNLPIIAKFPKRRIWWSPDGVKWHIKKEQTSQYVPFYLTENVIYKY